MLTLLFADGHDYLPIGRSLIQDGALALYWPNSGFSVRFRAHSAIVSFKPFTSGAPLYLKAFLDGKAAKYSVTTGAEKLLFEALDDGEHTLTLLRVAESITSLYIESITLLGENAAFLDPPEERQRRIEFFGDSITCGYGVLAEPSVTGTDARAIQVTRGGIPTGLISVPLRYMHTPTEVICLRDLEATVRLITRFAQDLAPDTSFVPGLGGAVTENAEGKAAGADADADADASDASAAPEEA